MPALHWVTHDPLCRKRPLGQDSQSLGFPPEHDRQVLSQALHLKSVRSSHLPTGQALRHLLLSKKVLAWAFSLDRCPKTSISQMCSQFLAKVTFTKLPTVLAGHVTYNVGFPRVFPRVPQSFEPTQTLAPVILSEQQSILLVMVMWVTVALASKLA